MKRFIPLLAILPVMFLVACNPTGSVTENANPGAGWDVHLAKPHYPCEWL
jgi:hypothetical protein